MKNNNSILSDKKMVKRAIKDSFVKLNPKIQKENPVMFIVYIASIITTILYFVALLGIKDNSPSFILGITVLLWFTVLFANFAEAIAEGRGKAQADALRSAKKDVVASKIPSAKEKDKAVKVNSTELKKGDIVIVFAGDQIPADGDVIDGAASVDESAITGESAPVIRESGGDRSAVTGGTTVISDWLVIKVSNDPGESFMDKMIAMVEGAARKKTPNEKALEILLVSLTIIFLIVTVSLYTYSVFISNEAGMVNSTSITSLIALLVCLAPTTIGALLSAIGIAGMSRLNQANVLAMSGRAIEAAGDVDILMLDKTGTITLGNRQASEFIPVDGVDIKDVNQKSLRDKIGYIPQKGVLFSGTIESNLKYGSPNATAEDLEKSAQIAQALEFIDNKPEKYNTEISQGGTNVSGGQKQRLSIARALVKKPEVYIFDDSFSALDFKTDAILRKRLKSETKESVVLIVAQRIGSIMDADKIVVLNEGEVVGIGTHKELLKTCEIYHEIASSQLTEEELA